jgi:hypothetical protein
MQCLVASNEQPVGPIVTTWSGRVSGSLTVNGTPWISSGSSTASPARGSGSSTAYPEGSRTTPPTNRASACAARGNLPAGLPGRALA